jgi:hypothetical protein
MSEALRTLIVKLVEPRFIARAAAVILLALSALDMALPQLCEADFSPLMAARADVIDSGVPSDPGAPAQSAVPDDCFCCCSHIEPAAQKPELASLTPVSVLNLNPLEDLPPSTYHSLFRPPRLA